MIGSKNIINTVAVLHQLYVSNNHNVDPIYNKLIILLLGI